MAEKPTKPYLIRAIHEWCSDSGLTPYLSAKVDAETRVPREHVKNGEIVLNVSYDATHRLTIGNELIQFSARFNGASRECSIPVAAVLGIFARENGQGLFFPPDAAVDEAVPPEAAPGNSEVSGTPDTPDTPDTPASPANGAKPKLQIIK